MPPIWRPTPEAWALHYSRSISLNSQQPRRNLWLSPHREPCRPCQRGDSPSADDLHAVRSLPTLSLPTRGSWRMLAVAAVGLVVNLVSMELHRYRIKLIGLLRSDCKTKQGTLCRPFLLTSVQRLPRSRDVSRSGRGCVLIGPYG